MTRVIRKRMGSLMAEVRACKALLEEPITAPYRAKKEIELISMSRIFVAISLLARISSKKSHRLRRICSMTVKASISF